MKCFKDFSTLNLLFFIWLLKNHVRTGRNCSLISTGSKAKPCRSDFWPYFNPYTDCNFCFSFFYLWSVTNAFMEGVREFEKLSCIRFVPRKSEANYINVISGSGWVPRRPEMSFRRLIAFLLWSWITSSHY